MATIEANWLEQAKAKLGCGVSFSAEQLKTINLGLMIQTLLAKCPNILDGEEESSNNITITSLLARINCGQVLPETILLQGIALVNVKMKECEANLANNTLEEDEPCKIIASGIWTKTGGNNYIPVEGIKDTDSVQAIVHTSDDDEQVIAAKANEADERIDLIFDAAAVNDVTKVNYQVTRCYIA